MVAYDDVRHHHISGNNKEAQMKKLKKLIIKKATIRVLAHNLATVVGGVDASEAAGCAPSGIHTCAVMCRPF